ncbi:MAG: 6-phospho-beta-glucosidase, partial [Anaerolineae bacterium]|nr:6-phospho-beta-glucosidase [Anaerolineae bacterium]
FAMALRSIPAILEYAALIQEVSPKAWMFNFTNPAGLVTQALRDAGFERTVGICDSANGSQHAVAQFLDVDATAVQHEVYGLNHLSWGRRVWVNGEDVLPRLLQNPEFLSETGLAIYEPNLIQQVGAWLNEYLYYFYYAEKALESIQQDELTRGEEILQLNKILLNTLKQVDLSADPQTVLPIYYRYEQRRTATYMHYANDNAPSIEEADKVVEALEPPTDGGEGYAGVVLDIIEAFHTQKPLHIALNVPNDGAITGMRPQDVVEVSCTVDVNGIHPHVIGAIPEDRLLLMQQVKLYERLTVAAVRDRNRETAVRALMAHPLVLSYSRAKVLVDDYLAAHAPYVGEWA